MLKIEPKNYIKTLKGLFLYGWANNQALRSFRKGSSDRMCCTFHVFKSAEAQEKARPHLGSHSLDGKESQAPAVWDAWACPSRFLLGTPEGVAVPLFPARHRDVVLLPWAGTQSTLSCQGSCTPLTDFQEQASFLVNLSNMKWRMNWCKGHCCTGCLCQNISLSMQWNMNYSTILGSQPVSSRSPRSIQSKNEFWRNLSLHVWFMS